MTIDKQTEEALRLAEILEDTDQMNSNADISSIEVASELRRQYDEIGRLHALNAQLTQVSEELLEALKWIDRRCDRAYFTAKHPLHQIHWEMAHDAGACARAVIARAEGTCKAEGEQND